MIKALHNHLIKRIFNHIQLSLILEMRKNLNMKEELRVG